MQNLAFLDRRPNESLNDFLGRFRQGIRTIPREEGELLAMMLKSRHHSYGEIIESFKCVYAFEQDKKKSLAKREEKERSEDHE